MRIAKIFFILLVLFGCSKEGDTNTPVISPPQPTKFSVTISLNPSDGGSVSPTGGQYNEGQSVTFTVTPSQYYVFTGWSGSDTSTDNPLTIVINSNKSLTVNFEKKDTDGDGVTDDVDQCSDTPSGEEVNETGCSPSQTDTDSDGVVDSVDQDNSTREGVPVDENGVMLNPVYLDENGVTIKSEEWGIVGDIGVIDGVEYLIVNSDDLYLMIQSGTSYDGVGNDYSRVVTTYVTNMKDLFKNSSGNNSIKMNYDISSWDVSNVTNMEFMFFNLQEFNGDISNWNVSSVTSMKSMFLNSNFNNGDLSNWDVSNVTNMGSMFSGYSTDRTNPFNGDLSNWDISSVTDLNSMFRFSEFNGDLSNWDVSNVIDMNRMFQYNFFFNQDISLWNVSNVGSMIGMFRHTTEFNQDLSSWDVGRVSKCDLFLYVDSEWGSSQWTLPKPNFTNCDPGFQDTDGDGVTDDVDQCSNTPQGEEVDENGCTIVDYNGPVVQSFEFEPTTIDITNNPQTVTITIHVTDESGVDGSPYVYVQNNDNITGTQQGGFPKLTSGDIKDGVWTLDVEIPTGLQPGEWAVFSNNWKDIRGNMGSSSDKFPTQEKKGLTVINN